MNPVKLRKFDLRHIYELIYSGIEVVCIYLASYTYCTTI